MIAIYPLSPIAHSCGLDITALSYQDGPGSEGFVEGFVAVQPVRLAVTANQNRMRSFTY